jgi:phosphoglycolate phosphatase-like HAD superfamily hydrolase
MLIGLDLDGTLLDSRLRHVVALRQAADALAVPLSDDDAQTYFKLKCEGSSGIEALWQLGIPKAEGIGQRWVEIIESEELLAYDRLYSDTIDALERQLVRRNTLVLVTGRQNPPAALRQIARLGLEKYFREIIVVDSRDRSLSKAAATYRHNLSAIVGDTEIDFQWASDLRVNFYASSFGFRSQSFWNRRQVTSHASLSAIFDAITLTAGNAAPTS